MTYRDRDGNEHPSPFDYITTTAQDHLVACDTCRTQYPTFTKWLEDRRAVLARTEA